MQTKWSLIVAMDPNYVIGNNNTIPWHIPNDFKWFKKCTLNSNIVMGRKTWESIGAKPLPKRNHYILSRTLPDPNLQGVTVLKSFQELLSLNPDNLFIIGGAEIYKVALPYCNVAYISHIRKSYYGDTFFPPFKNLFTQSETILNDSEFEVIKYSKI